MKTALFTVALLAMALPSHAALVTLATFTPADGLPSIELENPNPGPAVLDNLGGSVAFTVANPALAPALVGPQAAFVSIGATAVGPASTIGGISQQFSAGTLTLFRTTPLNGSFELLSVDFTQAFLMGSFGGTTASFQATITGWSSDFITLPSFVSRGLTLSLTNLSTPLGLTAPPETQPFAFLALAGGTFYYEPAPTTGPGGDTIPEPASVTLLAAAVLLGAWRRVSTRARI